MTPEALRLPELLERAEAVAREVLRPNVEREDREARWPEAGMRALAASGLMGLHVPVSVGGHGLGLEGLVNISRVLARENPSAALCYAMHCVGTAVIAAKATAYQRSRFLEPIAAGEHITTLALSEPGTGSHFYLPESSIEPAGDDFIVRGVKSFVTNGAQADSYVVSTVAGAGTGVDTEAAEGVFSAVVVEQGAQGLRWGPEWRGFGMRGNSSRTATLDGVRVPREHLLGEEGDQLWYVFEVVTPYFLAAMAGTYLGIAEAAVDIAAEHLGSRRHSHTGDLLGANLRLAGDLGNMWIDLESARQLVLSAARRGDADAADALAGVLACKVAATRVAVDLTNRAMTLVGGIGFQENSHLSRLLRDARAGHIMAPTTQVLETWLGRSLLGMPLLQ
jgi:isovaleryl-CoA dehydrogenase